MDSSTRDQMQGTFNRTYLSRIIACYDSAESCIDFMEANRALTTEQQRIELIQEAVGHLKTAKAYEVAERVHSGALSLRFLAALYGQR